MANQAREDIRLHRGWRRHPKTLKLIRLLGPEAGLCLLELWCWAAGNRPKGDLAGLDRDDIAVVSGWEGDAGRWVEALVSVGWLDGGPAGNGAPGYQLHDWEEHQPFVARREFRQQRSKEANAVRWAKTRETGGKSPSRSPDRTPIRTPPLPAPAPAPPPLGGQGQAASGSGEPSGRPGDGWEKMLPPLRDVLERDKAEIERAKSYFERDPVAFRAALTRAYGHGRRVERAGIFWGELDACGKDAE